jgi:signal transduction histidine kinase
MRTLAPEPGFIPAYRIFAALRILFWVAVGPVLLLFELAGNPVLEVAAAAGRPLLPYFTLPYLAPLIAVDLLLLGLLLWPQAAQRLGSWYVPLTLVIGLLPLLVGYYRWPAENPLQSPFVMFFFVMALLIAWEYKYTYLSLYVAGLSMFQMGVAPPWPATLPWTVPFGWLVLQAVMMMLAGYITATLVSVQARQRADLAEAYERQAEANRRLQQYAATLEELSTTRERNRLARELHDTLAHSLSAVTVQLEAVRALWATQPDKAQRILIQADATARTGLAEARRALQALRAAPLEELGLGLALRELAETAAQRTGAQLDVRVPAAVTSCPSSDIEQGVYRIAQETLENIVRHAGAAHISVILEERAVSDPLLQKRAECLVLTVADDGLGADLDVVDPADNGGERLGIRGMLERAALIGGELKITSAPHAGTTVVLTVPVERGDDASCAEGSGTHL